MGDVIIDVPAAQVGPLASQFNEAAKRSGDKESIDNFSEKNYLERQLKSWHDRTVSQFKRDAVGRGNIDRIYEEFTRVGGLFQAGMQNELKWALSSAAPEIGRLDKANSFVRISFEKCGERFYVSSGLMYDLTNPSYLICFTDGASALYCSDAVSISSIARNGIR